MLHNVWIITKKELRDYFSSSAALLFLSIFLISVYIVFFWVEAFFARNLADVRPLFNWIPILFIFLISALTMHSWSEERRRGTIQLILTSSVSPWAYLLGKFLAVLVLIVVALSLTLPLPITASYLGDLDWGPVTGGYVAALFLAAAYIAIGLWSSSQTENQIVSLIVSIVIMGVLYAIGSATVTNLLNYSVGESLRALGSGSRFESITRGVLDLRDIFYYLTIVVLFLIFSRIKLESLRWANNTTKESHRRLLRLALGISGLILIANFLLNFVTQARIDLTQGNIYSLSDTTKDYLSELQEPLRIHGYFSSNTHPLLSPLVPRMRDLLNEYKEQGRGAVEVEFIDPLADPKFEEEAGVKYGIRPVSFHSETKYQASVINTYFNVLVEYEGQYQILNYKDLVELKASAGKHEVDLKNPEYQITRSVRSVVAKANRKIDSFEGLEEPLVVTGYVSSYAVLPKSKQEIISSLEELSNVFREESNENFDFLTINPEEDQLTQEYLRNKLSVRPIIKDDLTSEPYWFYFNLTDGNKTVPVNFSNETNKASVKESIIAAYKSLLPDSIKTIAIMRPLATPGPAGVIESPGIPKNFSILRKSLQQTMKVIDVDLRDGVVPSQVDFLLVLAPRYLHPAQIKAIQSFLANGGNVLFSSSSIDVNVSYFTEVFPVRSGLEPWLQEMGISIDNNLVLDSQHGRYSLPGSRAVGGTRVRETNLVDYPYIIDVRGDQLNDETGVTSKLGQIYVPWASPIVIDEETLNHNYKLTPLLVSSPDSWTSSSHSILPDFEQYPKYGFAKDNEQENSYVLATMIEGSFASEKDEGSTGRLVLVGSSSLFTNNFLDQMTQILRNEYRRPIQFMQNLIDWSLEDQGLLNVLRKHTQFTRTLTTLDSQEKTRWEYFNYGLGAIGLLLIGLIRFLLNKRSKLRAMKILQAT